MGGCSSLDTTVINSLESLLGSSKEGPKVLERQKGHSQFVAAKPQVWGR